jgi:carboxypeptidase C (cathepsin A)
VWAVHGAADLVTPYLASAWLLDQIGAVAGPDRVRTTVHDGGHMFYMRPDAAVAVAEEARAFYAR